MYYLLFIISGFFNIITTRIYYDSVFSVRSRKTSISFWFTAITLSGCITFLSIYLAGIHSPLKLLLMVLLNYIYYFVLSLFFIAKNLAFRFLMTVCLQSILSLAECAAGGFLFYFFNDLSNASGLIQDSVVNIASSILSLLLISVFCYIWKKRTHKLLISQIVLICITPLCSLTFILFLPYQAIADNGSENHIYITFIILLVLNFLNYYFLDNLLRQKELQERLRNRDAQISYQTEKYNQLANAYKGTRRIVHEIKHRDTYLASCLQNKEYGVVEEELRKGMSSFETRFFNSSTHNLVIDTFISSYGAMATEKAISFQTDIKIIKEDIPVVDYDLCILLGNLLDNCFNAAELWKNKTGSYENFIIKCLITTQNKFFIIHIENSSVSAFSRANRKDNLMHGFGLINVQRIVENYSGFYHQQDNSFVYETTITIPVIRTTYGDIYNENDYKTILSATPLKKSRKTGIFHGLMKTFRVK